MPLSRFTQTLPLDLAEVISPSEAAPAEAVLLVVFLAEVEALEGAAELAGALAGLLVADLLGADAAGAAAGVVVAELPALAFSPLFFERLFLVVPVSALVACSPPAAALSAGFFLGLFLVDAASVLPSAD